jgi:hypothetical protein
LQHLRAYPALREAVEDLVVKKISENVRSCKEYLHIFLQVESCYPNVNHPDFQRRYVARTIYYIDEIMVVFRCPQVA